MRSPYRVIGPVSLWGGSTELPLDDGTRFAYAALVAAGRGAPVATDTLADVVWPAGRPPAPATRLRALLTEHAERLRTVGLPWTTRHVAGGWTLDVPRGSVDADLLEDLLAAGRTALNDGRPREARALLVDSLGLVLDRPYADVGQDWFTVHRDRLAATQARAVVGFATAALALGRPDDALPILESAAEEAHLRTEARIWERLVVALVRTGRWEHAEDAATAGRAAVRADGLWKDVVAGLNARVRARDPRLLAPSAGTASPGSAAGAGRPTPAAPTPQRRSARPTLPTLPTPPTPPTLPDSTGSAPDALSLTSGGGLGMTAAASSPRSAPPATGRPARPAELGWALFGRDLVRRDGDTVRLDRAERAVAARLLVTRNRDVTTADLVVALHGPGHDNPGAAARRGVEAVLDRLDDRLGRGVLRRSGDTVRLVVDPDAVDVDLAAALVAAATGSATHRADRLREALDLLDGEPLPGGGDPTVQAERLRLAAWRDDVRAACVAAEVASDRHALALPDLDLLTRRRPLSEDLWELLLVATAAVEGPDEAEEVYRRAARRLAELLGADPGPSLRAARDRLADG